MERYKFLYCIVLYYNLSYKLTLLMKSITYFQAVIKEFVNVSVKIASVMNDRKRYILSVCVL